MFISHPQFIFQTSSILPFPFQASQVALVVKNLPASAGEVKDMGLKDTLKEEMATYSSILAWRITWTKEPGRLQSTG